MMTTTTAPSWLRRSDQAVTWARGMLSPHRAVVIDCETTDLPGRISGRRSYQNRGNRPRTRATWLARSVRPAALSVHLQAVEVEK